MRIFICGYSRSGKTHLANLLADRLDVKAITASGWLHKEEETRAKPAENETKQEYINRLTQMSLEYLANDPDVCIRYIGQKGTIVEGLRNPRDFAHLFDAGTDVFIWCENTNVTEAATKFESSGLVAILRYVQFQQIIHPDMKLIRVVHEGPPDGLENELDTVLSQLGAQQVWRLK
jgi:hypothetical protein